MGTKTKPTGVCKICGAIGELDEEHVPPRSAFNKHTVLYSEMRTEGYFRSILDEAKDFNKKQGGVGFYTICKKCNNDTGAWYGGAYAEWCHQGMAIARKATEGITLYLPLNVRPLNVLKQIVCMFFSVNGDAFRIKYPELVKFVKDKRSQGLPDQFKIYCYFTLGPMLRYQDLFAQYEIPIRDSLYFSEIAFPPLGYVLCIKSKPPDTRLCDISHFSHWPLDRWRTTWLRVPFYEVNSTVPGNYISRERLEKNRTFHPEDTKNVPPLTANDWGRIHEHITKRFNS